MQAKKNFAFKTTRLINNLFLTPTKRTTTILRIRPPGLKKQHSKNINKTN